MVRPAAVKSDRGRNDHYGPAIALKANRPVPGPDTTFTELSYSRNNPTTGIADLQRIIRSF